MSEQEWHGWGRSYRNVSLHVGPYPRRKTMTLYVMREGTLYPLASFANEDAAREAMEVLDALILADA